MASVVINPWSGLSWDQKVVWLICVFWVLCAPLGIQGIRAGHLEGWLVLVMSGVCLWMIVDSFRARGHWYRHING